MPYYVTKTGLEAFDTARAWGWALILNVLTDDDVAIRETDWTFLVDPVSPVSDSSVLAASPLWGSLFAENGWQYVFITAKAGWSGKRDQVRSVLEREIPHLLSDLTTPANSVTFGSGENLPGGLDPSGFKSLRHPTRARYGEGQLSVSEKHWALACLGMATCGTYRYSREAGQTNWLVLLPTPQQIWFNYFRDVQDLLRLSGLPRYYGVQNAAAHYAVQLAERLRRRAAAQGSLQDRFSSVIYFRLFGAGQQTKPAQGNQLRLEPLMEAIARDPHSTQAVLTWLDYCFRLGATQGSEELALAATELVMRWDLAAYDRLARVLVRYQAQHRIRHENLPTASTIVEVMRYVSS